LATCPLGYLPVAFAEGQTEEGRPYLVVALDRPSKVAFAEVPPQAKRMVAADFLRRVVEKLPDKGPSVLTDHGVEVPLPPHQFLPGGHRFERVCRAFGGAPRLPKPAPPWTNGQLERFNRTRKAAPVPRHPYESTAQLNEHLQAFLRAYNHAKRLKRLRGLTPHEFICAQGQKHPNLFTQDPTQLTLRLYI
jgi:transposase InsO family protein